MLLFQPDMFPVEVDLSVDSPFKDVPYRALLAVEWHDAVSGSCSWQSDEEVQEETLLEVYTVGFYIPHPEDTIGIRLVSATGKDADHRGVWVIPISQIQKAVVLNPNPLGDNDDSRADGSLG